MNKITPPPPAARPSAGWVRVRVRARWRDCPWWERYPGRMRACPTATFFSLLARLTRRSRSCRAHACHGCRYVLTRPRHQFCSFSPRPSSLSHTHTPLLLSSFSHPTHPSSPVPFFCFNWVLPFHLHLFLRVCHQDSSHLLNRVRASPRFSQPAPQHPRCALLAIPKSGTKGGP